VKRTGFPADFGPEQARNWLCESGMGSPQPWTELKRRIASLPAAKTDEERAKASRSVEQIAQQRAVIRLVREDPSLTVADLEAVLDRLEGKGTYDDFLAGLVFRNTKTVGDADLPRLLGRVERHAAISAALRTSEVRTRPIQLEALRPEAWRSKALKLPFKQLGPASCELVSDAFVPEARAAFEAGTVLTWDRDAVMQLTLVDGEASLARRAGWEPLVRGATVKWRRVDMIVANKGDVVMRHATLGDLRIPAGATLGPWNFADALGEDARRSIDEQLERAARGDRASVDALAAILPAARAAIAKELAAGPESPGAPALRMLMTIYLE
jgi:hypothetical protein